MAEAAVIRDIRKELHMQLERTVVADNGIDINDEVVSNSDNNNNINIKSALKHSGSISNDGQSGTPLIVIDDDNFKSPPRVQTLSTVSDVTPMPSAEHITRHSRDPRLSVRSPVTNSFISPISTVLSDSSAIISTTKAVKSCARSVSKHVTSSSAVSQLETSNSEKHKETVKASVKRSRLSSRLTALFSRQSTINTTSNDSTLVKSPQSLHSFSSEVSTTDSAARAVSTATSSASSLSTTENQTSAV